MKTRKELSSRTIVDITYLCDGGAMLFFPHNRKKFVDDEFLRRFKPQLGGHYLKFSDDSHGYQAPFTTSQVA
jgi:hypothetical protein